MTERTKALQKSPTREVMELARRAAIVKMDTPMAREMKEDAEKEFTEKVHALAKRHNTKVMHHKKNWVLVAGSGEKIAMQKGYYITTKSGVLHRVIPR